VRANDQAQGGLDAGLGAGGFLGVLGFHDPTLGVGEVDLSLSEGSPHPPAEDDPPRRAPRPYASNRATG
jgi:hypothetical protein